MWTREHRDRYDRSFLRSLKSAEKEPSRLIRTSYDAGKNVMDNKRQVLVDTQGLAAIVWWSATTIEAFLLSMVKAMPVANVAIFKI